VAVIGALGSDVDAGGGLEGGGVAGAVIESIGMVDPIDGGAVGVSTLIRTSR
jgi:hypothetical protein